ncbi:hypothetical protein Q4489_18095 [Thalassotalea sp. 1_MG-2023]|uniref:hypothetical protein n=1 Tax=Thalassotalea sp. 1_MG-2023 TaxID=3062680 RepID=UPI0026E42D95|nr:hypothetical protein [Thalassotalea sp. 1_MG-2023]MDO6428914.1 hypothetical protein [Thalassotalea sp. 1_MG-2023]
MKNGKWHTNAKRFLCITSLILTSSLTHAENWQAYVDKNINVDSAHAVVNQYEPIVRCDGHSTPDTQSCYSTPTKVLVVDANSGQLAGYEIGHTNQNSPRYMLQKYVTSIEVSANVANLMTNTLDAYEILNDTAEAISSNKLTAASSSTGNCDSNSPTAKAVQAFTDGAILDQVHNKAAQGFDQRFSSLAADFFAITLKYFSFNVASNGVSLEGTFQFDAITKTVITRFGETNDAPFADNYVVAYHLTVKNNAIHIIVSDVQTKLDGVPLNMLKATGLTSVNDCLIKELNKYIAASVDSYHTDSVGADSLPIGWNRIPVHTDGVHINNKKCVWTFHDKDKHFMQVLGSCPHFGKDNT